MKTALILVALLACAGCAKHHHDSGPGATDDSRPGGPPPPPTGEADWLLDGPPPPDACLKRAREYGDAARRYEHHNRDDMLRLCWESTECVKAIEALKPKE